jgi:hypothetical protein
VFPFTTRNATYLSYSFQLIWQYGDRQYHTKKWTEAADWFRAGSHQVFKNMGSSNVSKCLRKAALCHVQQREYAKAASDIRLCANSEATTHYMTLLIAVHQGQMFFNHRQCDLIMTFLTGLEEEGQRP